MPETENRYELVFSGEAEVTKAADVAKDEKEED